MIKATVRASIVFGVATLGLLVTLSNAQQAGQPDTPISFSHNIRPILEQNCLQCHGAAVQLSGLDLRSRESALEGGDLGPAIVPGDSGRSRLYRRVARLEEPAMPMDGNLTVEQLAAIRAWIDQGAVWDAELGVATGEDTLAALETYELPPDAREYWAFQRPAQAPLPLVRDELTHPIDRFLEQERESRGLVRAPRADPSTLIRRAYLDLTGLPPSPRQVDAFLADTAPGAWERLIDDLLASPRYGERWGRHWLDVARYADSGGFQNDTHRPHAWRYRDYVIESFNSDKPFDRFVREQIAGDEIPDRSDESLIATYFLRAGPRVQHREKDNPERRFDYLDDVLATIGKGIVGMTLQCARCHDHKFDPISQNDYYRMQAAIFGYVETDYPLGLSREEAEAYLRNVAEIDGAVKALRDEIATIEGPYADAIKQEQVRREYPENVQIAVMKPESERTPGEKLLARQVLESAVRADRGAVTAAMSLEDRERRQALEVEIERIQAERPEAKAMAHITTDGDHRSTPDGVGDSTVGCPACRVPDPDAGPFLQLGPGPGDYRTPPSYFLIRGDPGSRGSPIEPGFIEVATYGETTTALPPTDGRTSGRRRALAEWLTSIDNPLTARVMMNRIWHHHFGRGIVATLDNFGVMGEQPTHPELLDWLAVEFMDRGWSIKEMHRLIMTSEAYQMASEHDDAVSAAIDPDNLYLWRTRLQRIEGEIVRDSMMAVAGTLDATMGGEPIFPYVPDELLKSLDRGIWRNHEDGPEVWRRSIYIYAKRSLPFPMVHVFDLPDQNVSFGARNVSTVPTQALTLMNNGFVLGQARRFAERVRQEAGSNPAAQIDLAYRIALTRPPTNQELSLALDMVGEQSLEDFMHVVLNLSEFLYTR